MHNTVIQRATRSCFVLNLRLAHSGSSHGQLLLPRFQINTSSRALITDKTQTRWRSSTSSSSSTDSTFALTDEKVRRYPTTFPSQLRDRYHPDFIKLYDRYLAGRVENQCLPLKQSRGAPTYGGLNAQEAYEDGVRWHDVQVRRGPKDAMVIRIYDPPNLHSRTPIVLHFPGGGFVFNTVESEHGLTAHLCSLTSCTIVSVSYRLAPEHPFPIAVHDALAAFDWVKKYLSENMSRSIAITGTSAGGGLAAMVGVTEGVERGVKAVGVWVPITDWTFDPVPFTEPSNYSSLPKSLKWARELLLEYGETRSLEELPDELKQQLGIELDEDYLERYDDLADTPFLSVNKMQWFRSQYLPNCENWVDPFASPLLFFKYPGVDTALPLKNPFATSRYLSPKEQEAEDEEERRGRLPRKMKTYPPTSALPLTVPPMRIVVAAGDVLRNQGEEFGVAVRASLFPQDGRTRKEDEEEHKDRNGENGHVDNYGYGSERLDTRFETVEQELERDVAYRLEAEEYIQIEVVEGAAHSLVSAAGENELGRQEVKNMAEWIVQMFSGEDLSEWMIPSPSTGQNDGRRGMKKRRGRSSKL